MKRARSYLLSSVAYNAMPLPKLNARNYADILAWAYKYLGLTHLGESA